MQLNHTIDRRVDPLGAARATERKVEHSKPRPAWLLITQARRREFAPAALALAAAVGLGCASAKIERSQSHIADQAIPEPPIALVFPFALNADDVAHDTLGLGDGTEEPKSAEGRRLQDALVFKTVAKLNERGINAKAGSDTSTIPPNALLVKGQFVTISEGDRTKRMLIGFGVGAERITIRVQIYRATNTGLQRLNEAEATARGGRAPGMAVPLGVGAQMGRAATAAVVSGGMSVARELSGGLDQAADNLAEQIAQHVVAFYRERGWI